MKTILIVDDDPHERTVLCDILSEEGFRPLAAENGQTALALLEKQPVDLIITDRSMPHVDGLQLLEALRDRGSAIPVIMVSAFGEERLWGQAIGLGAKDYILKPFVTADVLKQVRRYLKEKPKP